MAKRFRNTKLSREAWYRKLKPAFKCVWDFLCDECDEAGMWSIDQEALEFFVGEKVELEEVMEAVNQDKLRLELFAGGKIWIVGFIEFQYGKLSANCKPHVKIIDLLHKYNLFDRVTKGYTKGLQTLQEEDKDMDKEEDKEKGGSRGKTREPNFKPSSTNTELKQVYKSEVLPEVQGLPVRDGKERLANFISEQIPSFPEPYADLWNLSAQGTGLSQIESISDSRMKKFQTRVREPAFNFIKILEEIKRSEFLKGKNEQNWRVTWDWIFENDKNYLKIIEGQFK